MTTSLSKSAAFDRALAIANDKGWVIVDANADSGMIEATETTLLWGFKDDIAIRISEQGDLVAIDLHSVSRVGMSDVGANAKRIEGFLKTLDFPETHKCDVFTFVPTIIYPTSTFSHFS